MAHFFVKINFPHTTQVPSGMLVGILGQGIEIGTHVFLAPAGRSSKRAGFAFERGVRAAQNGLSQVFDAVRDVIQVIVIPSGKF